MPVMKQLNVGGVTYDTVGEASVTQVVSTGTKIATVSIDGTSTDLYAPSGGSSVEPATAAPIVDGTAAVGTSAKYAREDHVHPTDTSRAAASDLAGKQETLVSGTNIKTINGDSILGSGNLTVGGNPTPMTAQEVAAAVDSAWVIPPTVTVSLTNPYNPNRFRSCSVRETDLANAYASLGSIDSPTGSGTFQMSGDYPYLQVFVEGTSVGGGTATCTGGVTFYSNPESGVFNMQVTTDGTVTIDGVDYDD